MPPGIPPLETAFQNPRTVGEITLLLDRWKDGDDEAADGLFPLVYGELKAVAVAYLARERADHTLQATALVHEAYLRLSQLTELDVHDRSHFYAVAARTMRRILVDHARKQLAGRRIGRERRATLDEGLLGRSEDPSQLLAVHEALRDLEQRRPRAARLVELRFFGGLSESEAGEALELSRSTLSREWRFAKLWLYDYLNPLPSDALG